MNTIKRVGICFISFGWLVSAGPLSIVLNVRALPDIPGDIEIRLTNTSHVSVIVPVEVVFDSYVIATKGADGKEPPRTLLGDSIIRKINASIRIRGPRSLTA